MRKESEAHGYPGGNAPNSVTSLFVPPQLAIIGRFLARVFSLWPFFGSNVGFVGCFLARALASLAVFWLEFNVELNVGF